jgi:hypothetical protein
MTGLQWGGHVLKKRSFRLHITTLISMSIRCRWTIEMELNVYFINIPAQRLWASNTGFLRTTAMIYLSLICYCFTIYTLPLISGSRCSSFSIVSGYGLDDRAMRFDSRQRQEDFSSRLCVQTWSGAHPASCTMRTEGPFPGGMRGRGVILIIRHHLVSRS